MQIQNLKPRFLIASIIPQNFTQRQSFESVKELISLVESFGGLVIDITLQKREVHDKGMYLGSGKLDEISEIIKEKNIDILVLNSVIIPGQIYEMTTLFQKINPQIEVWDRVDLILKIFSKRAFTAEAKLQIELAAMRHMGPRIFGMGMELSRQGGGIGTRGIGETNTERMKRHWRAEIKETKKRLDKVIASKSTQIENRKNSGLKTVALVGYTNAGKTSLFNLLTSKRKLVKNTLFVTLESYTGRVFLKNLGQEVLLADTIGFIRGLPPQLIDAFYSTLMESIHADILLLIIDITDSDMSRKIKVVEQTLKEIGIRDESSPSTTVLPLPRENSKIKSMGFSRNKKIIYVFNKVDLLKDENLIDDLKKNFNEFNPQFISVKQEKGIENLKTVLTNSLRLY